MRVLMLSWEYTPHIVGGLGKHVAEVVPALVQAGAEVHLVTPAYGGGEAEESLGGASRIYRVPPPGPSEDMSRMGMPTNFFMNAWRTNINLEGKGREVLERFNYQFDLIHAHDWLVAFSGVALKSGCRMPLLATIHATEMGRNRGVLHEQMQRDIHTTEWWLTFEAWRVVTTSQFMLQQIQQQFDLPADKIDIIANGIDTARFDALDGVDLSDFRTKWAQPDEPIVFFVGRLVPEKGAQMLVEAAPAVLSQVPNARFVIAGTGGYRSDIERRVWELGVQDHVTFAGFVSDDDRDKLYKVCNAAVFPSLYEPFGIVALEAMAAGAPVIVTETGGLAEVVKLHETGLKVYPGDAGSLAWGITHTLQHPDWAAQRATNARREVRELYNWPHIAQQTIDVYNRVSAEAVAIGWGKRGLWQQAAHLAEHSSSPHGASRTARRLA